MSYHHWQARGAGADILGRAVTINATSFTVVGVAHEGFTGTTAVVGPEFWLPAGVSDLVSASQDAAGAIRPGAARRLMAIARLRPGLPERSAGPLVSMMGARLEQARPVANRNLELQVAPLPRLNTSMAPTDDGEVWAAVVFLMAMAGIVLLVASLNLANMLRARSASRRREAAIRLAIGGSHWLIVRPLLVEALMLAGAGGAAGLALGVAVTSLLAGSVTPLAQFGVTDYFRTLGLPILRGREFSPAEELLPSRIRPAVVDTSLAERLWPGADPMGQQLVVVGAEPGVPTEALVVVGVVPGIRQGLFDRHSANLYVPYGGTFRAGMTIHARSRRAGPEAESSLLTEMQRRVRQADPDLPILAARTLRTHRDTSLYVWIAQAGARLFTTLAVVALLLAAIGLYGIRSFVVSARTKEIGIRMAVGATSGQTVRLIVGEGLRLAAIGVGAGVLLALPVAWLLGGWVYGVSTFDPVAMGGAALVMLMVLLVASYVPARRAAAIDPLVALRHD